MLSSHNELFIGHHVYIDVMDIGPYLLASIQEYPRLLVAPTGGRPSLSMTAVFQILPNSNFDYFSTSFRLYRMWSIIIW